MCVCVCVLSLEERRLNSASVFNNMTGSYAEENQALLRGAKTAQRQWSQISTVGVPKENLPHLGISQSSKGSQKGSGIFIFGDTQNLTVQVLSMFSNCYARTTLSWGWYQITSRDPFQPKLFGSSDHIFKIKIQGLFQS